MVRIGTVILALALAGCGSPRDDELAVSDAWTRSTAPGLDSAAVYATITNRGGADDKLTAVITDRAAMAMLHEGSNENGIARMRMVSSLAIPSGATVELKPGGAHIMLTGLHGPLASGQRFTLRFRFAHGGERLVPVTVVAAGSR